MQKRLFRSNENKVLAGILGGIGEYFNIDPTVVRLGFVVLALVTAIFPCLIGYIFAYFIIPEQRV
ncbi:PspC domain-containing protein [Sporolactobacillus laevolacticus]|uniref:Membrane protein n=1 Tax=Sporolactobacillus laevolacticus DSM 442 TaxID=1395513 RepID=V6IWJ1_9BACL|nr:PspC domain-containing protein [Sporolactobacillus laevolacticus]EST11590.1 membrane protein [Sporolactobacillus laevolacticus DSM 442]